MSFKVEFAGLAADKFRKLDKAMRERIVAKLREVADNPKRHASSLHSIGAFRIRVGDYRLVVDVDWDGQVIYVLTLGHRSTIYRQ